MGLTGQKYVHQAVTDRVVNGIIHVAIRVIILMLRTKGL